MSARIQTWFPFSMQVCVNGREWLSRRMDEIGLPYQRHENGFPWIDDFTKAQTIMDRMHKINWPRALDALAKKLNPAHGPMFRGLGMSYYWSAFQTEWASDTAFTSSHALAAIYPQLTRGAIATFGSRDVLRFLGKRPDRRYQGEAPRDYKDRPEGVRIKHQAYRNSVKAYDKSGSVLRVETTITNPGAFQSYRSSQGDPDGPKSWRQMRKGVADMHRRAEVSQQCNQRYAEALASLDTSTPIIQLAAKVCRPARKNGRRYRALRPWSEQDRKLLESIRPRKASGAAAGLYAGEQDRFCFMIDPTGWTECEDQAFAPGFFLWNSEVGRRSVGVSTFWRQQVCAKHILWDAVELRQVSRKHTSHVHDALVAIRQTLEKLVEKRDQRKDGFVRVMQKAMRATLGDDADEVHKMLAKSGINRSLATKALEIARRHGRFTIFAVVDALTSLAAEQEFAAMPPTSASESSPRRPSGGTASGFAAVVS